MSTTTRPDTAGSDVDMGLVDLLNGLIAKLILELQSQRGSDAAKIPVRAFCNILHEMQQEPEFQHDLRDLDFRQIGGNSVSNALGDFLFLGGAFGGHTVPNPALSTITLTPDRAKKRLTKLSDRYGKEGESKLHKLASRFLDSLLTSESVPQS